MASSSAFPCWCLVLGWRIGSCTLREPPGCPPRGFCTSARTPPDLRTSFYPYSTNYTKMMISGCRLGGLLPGLLLRPLLQHAHAALRQQHMLAALHGWVALNDELIILVGSQA